MAAATPIATAVMTEGLNTARRAATA
jgi:hypothetical protein